MTVTDGGGAFFFGVLYVVEWIQGLSAKQSNCGALRRMQFCTIWVIQSLGWGPVILVVARILDPLPVLYGMDKSDSCLLPITLLAAHMLQKHGHLPAGFFGATHQTWTSLA